MILSEAKLIVFLSVVNVLLAHGAETDSAASDCCHPSEPDAKRNVVSAVFFSLARPSVSYSLQITNCCCRYASPYLWNQPPSFRQPHSVHFPCSPHLAQCGYHLITVPSFALTIYHSFVSLSFQT